MKKEYSKPTLRVEHFSLSQSIAVNCGWTDENYLGSPTHKDKYTCGWNDGVGNVIWLSSPTCGKLEGPDYVHEEYCYNNPTGLLTIYASY